MSLINQALRKAQRDRTPERMSEGNPKPGMPARPGYPSVPNRSGLRPALVIGLALTVAILIGLVVGLSIVIFTDDSTTEPTVQTSAPAGSTTSAPKQLDPATPGANESITPQITPPAQSQANAGSSPGPNIVEELRLAREAAEAKAASEAQAAAAAKARAAAEPNQAIIEWLGASKISGVRLAGDNSRVILNGEAFSIGEVVNFSLGLEVLLIQETRVLFEDVNGKRYMKRL